MTPALETRSLRKAFGGLTVTDGVDLRLMPGDRHALIGPNGAGKTTLVDQIAGGLRPDAGQVLLAGQDVTRLGPAARARRGLGRTFQISELFGSLPPARQIALAVAQRRGGGLAGAAAETAALIGRMGLDAVADRPASALAYGQARALDIALALAGGPRVLLLDEPAAGLPEPDRRALLATLAALPDEVAVLMIEHDMDLVFSFARSVSVLVAGRIIAEGPPDAIRADPRVRAVYLGEPDAEA